MPTTALAPVLSTATANRLSLACPPWYVDQASVPSAAIRVTKPSSPWATGWRALRTGKVGRPRFSSDDERAIGRDRDAVRLVGLAAAEIGGEGQRTAVGRDGGHEGVGGTRGRLLAGERLDDAGSRG